ncbi:MAG: Mth938-like domain-containing protein [Pseudomonadota bacterium]
MKNINITADPVEGIFLIKSYGPGRLNIGDQTFNTPIMISPTHLSFWDEGKTDFTFEILQSCLNLISCECELMLIGFGSKMRPIPQKWHDLIHSQSVPVDFMATPSAIHAYNITVGDGRLTTAFLIPPDA